jgi:hypothetical protein
MSYQRGHLFISSICQILVCKGSDRIAATIRREGEHFDDEIHNYLTARFIGASEAVYRIFQFEHNLNDLLCIYQNNNLCIIIPLTKRVRLPLCRRLHAEILLLRVGLLVTSF